jgi:glycerate kinase
VILGVGGSATNDLGLGALEALGLEFLSESGERLSPPTPGTWAGLARIGGRPHLGLPPLLIACDVDNPLLGRRGAAAVFGPQKGLRSEDWRRLEHESARVALMLGARCGQPDTLMDAPGAGAAGGTAFGLMCAAGARLLNGSALVAAWLDLEARLAAADLVLTGEGCFDLSSLEGKGPGAIAARARALGKPVHIFAGRLGAGATLEGAGVHVITPGAMPEEAALRTAGENLARAVQRVFP